MYVITFYSFKGGVGRSMALVNVGTELARMGKRVLLVDFDLEAPSLTSFNLEATASCRAGVVDFVNEYLDTDRAPDVRQFGLGSADVRFRRLPLDHASWGVGRRVPASAGKDQLADLYESRAGYLLMEEMKAQWDSHLRPDYVLIDSRTGHSDVSGIRTRQLPDAVSFVFVPNRQNLDGLARTVGQVRAATTGEGARKIEMFFVESNVPYYDDERRTLETNRKAFRERLAIRAFDATLHQHPHLSVLNQSVFVEEFPDTSLAVEYRTLTEILRSRNLGDRDAVLPRLKAMARDLRFSPGNTTAIPDLEAISQLHGSDPEVCLWLGRVSRQLGDDVAALIQFNQAIEHGYSGPEVFLERASLRLRSKSDVEAVEAEKDLHTALRLLSDSPKVGDVRIAIRNLLSLKPQDAGALADLPAVRRMSARQKIELASDFYSSDSGCEFVYALLREIPSDQDLTAPDRIAWASNFALACIRTKRFQEAVEILSASLSRDQPEIELTFNRAIAIWGQEGIAPVDEFRRVIGCESTRPERGHYPNYLQCIAIAAYVSGDIERALGLTERAKRLAQQRPTTHFSAWRYLNVSPREFARDCDDMHRQMVAGEALSFPAIRALVSH